MTRLTTGFGFRSTAAEVLDNVDLSGKRAIVTGGASGIGVEIARALAGAGAAVTLAGLPSFDGEPVAAELRASTGNDAIDARGLDLGDLDSVRAFAEQWQGPLHILVNNAGIMAYPELAKTPQGLELQFGINYFGHFALATCLRRALFAADGARIVSVSSTGHHFSPVIFDDIHFDFVPYDPVVAYGQSKSAAALLSVGVTQNWSEYGVFANALHPGAVPSGLQKHTGGTRTPVELRKTAQQGAATSTLLAGSPLLANIGGRYFENCNESAPVDKRTSDFSTGGYAPYAMDPDNAQRLWKMSHALIADLS
ncbi:SDR family NAD(P)-dependent oxidoreductase [Sphingobium sp.]|uniref:SDR family NAD(P)-dependent oxidoreductase n=1 Tax=Sphingobium sp. TaxID=1912891 RepID=UPI003B3B02D7